MSAEDNELRKAADQYEAWADLGGIAVIVGVFAEAWLTLWPLEGDGLQQLFEALATVVVGVGIAAEIIFSRKAANRHAVLLERSEKRLGEAIDRAANAELETARVRALVVWRTLEEHSRRAFAPSLRESGAAASVRITVLANDPESLNFASQFAIGFRAAGWEVGYRFESYATGMFFGVCVPQPQENWLDEMKAVNRRVRDALIDADITFLNGWPPGPYMRTDSGGGLPAPIAVLYIGPKRMPEW